MARNRFMMGNSRPREKETASRARVGLLGLGLVAPS
jgi:hypothetical protein